MNCLPSPGFCQRGNLLRCPRQRLANARTRRSSDHIVAIERGLERNGCVEVFAELRTELAQLIERKVAEFDAFFESKANGVSDSFMSCAERHAFVHEIRGSAHRIQIARLRR